MNAHTARLFFALWPDDAVRSALGRLAQSLHRACGGRIVATPNIHLTLAFLGSVPRARMSALSSLAAAISLPVFDLVLDTQEYWRRRGIVCAGATRCPEALRALAERLSDALEGAGFRGDERDYMPHVTLLREARCRPRVAQAAIIRWPVQDFVLVESSAVARGVSYEVVERWPLASRPAPLHAKGA